MGAGNQLAYFGTTEIDRLSTPDLALDDDFAVFDTSVRKVKTMSVQDIFTNPFLTDINVKNVYPQIDSTYTLGASGLAFLNIFSDIFSMSPSGDSKRYLYEYVYNPSLSSQITTKSSSQTGDLNQEPLATWGGSEISDYTNVATNNDTAVTFTTPANEYGGFLFEFDIYEASTDISSLKVLWRGRDTSGVTYSLKIWDFTNTTWVSVGTSNSGTHNTISGTYTSNLEDYVDSNKIYLLVRTDAVVGTIETLETDFVYAEVIKTDDGDLTYEGYDHQFKITSQSNTAFVVESTSASELFKVNTFNNNVEINGRFYFDNGILFNSATDLFLNSGATGAVSAFSESSVGENKLFKIYGYISAASSAKYGAFQINDTDDYFHIVGEDSNILGLAIDMDTIISDNLTVVETVTANRITLAEGTYLEYNAVAEKLELYVSAVLVQDWGAAFLEQVVSGGENVTSGGEDVVS